MANSETLDAPRVYRNRDWWEKEDKKWNTIFPVGTRIMWKKRGGKKGLTILQGRTLAPVLHGRVRVENVISGKMYDIAVENISKTLNQSDSRTELLPFDRPFDGVHSTQKIYPWSTDELTAHTTLIAVRKALKNISLNRDSFRNPKLFDLLKMSQSALGACIDELESYTEYPTDA
jgi:hypothetical protein